MNSNRAIHRRARGRNRRFDFMRQASAVGVAQRDQRDARVIDRLETRERVFGIMKIAVEEMLGVENRLVEVLFQKRDRVVDDLEIFVERNPERLAHVHVPGLADHGRDRRPVRSSSCRLRSAAARTPERRVDPNAAIFACRILIFLTSLKNAASRSFEPGHPPSI